MIVLYVLGYFNRNKQNSYAALIYVTEYTKAVFSGIIAGLLPIRMLKHP